jgi:hypothetical protein
MGGKSSLENGRIISRRVSRVGINIIPCLYCNLLREQDTDAFAVVDATNRLTEERCH